MTTNSTLKKQAQGMLEETTHYKFSPKVASVIRLKPAGFCSDMRCEIWNIKSLKTGAGRLIYEEGSIDPKKQNIL